MKKMLFVVMVFLVSCSVNAQMKRRNVAPANPTKFSIGLEAGVPVGDYSTVYSVVVGGSFQLETMPASDLGLTISAGYLNWSLKEAYGKGNAGFIPVLAGVKYYFGRGAFIHPQIGAAFGTKTGQGTSFAYSPGLGYNFSQTVDAEIKYTGISNKYGSLNNVGLRVGFNF